ncbi:helix-turn-helix domain-containing protein [Actinoplanes sp. NPDC051859]|uniref:helix-turn-helix domain-containing protein n=1 Tax=Actinoplanes sp. NPDC051859 TaxID=3363909 RepID=UPI0037AD7F27
MLVAEAGQAVWVAPEVRHCVVLAAGSVALPISFEADVLPLTESCVVTVPPGWEDWLAYRTAIEFGFTTGVRPDSRRMLDLLADVQTGRAGKAPRLPPLPRSPGARLVVQSLLRNPASRSTSAELATVAMTSARTLQRQLKNETGHSLAQWRIAVRIDAAAALLALGRDIGWTAHHVGYASVSSFAHAFAERMGTSPGRYAAMRGAAAKEERLPTARVRYPEAEPPRTPELAPLTWTSTFQGALYENLLWVYRGSVIVEVSGTSWHLEAGDVLWPRPGITHRMAIAQGAIVLPLGWRLADRPAPVGPPTVVRMPADAEAFLLHQVVANHDLLHPQGHDKQEILELLHSPPAVPERLPEAVETVMSAVIRNPADRRTLADWGVTLGIEDARLRRSFARAVGESFLSWRANVRMCEARLLIWEEHPPSVVARRLGYRHLSTFTKAFVAVHGMSPREWLRRATG